jgi:3-oxoacyl-(acyl-carrier-protein) synthase/pimeloyl-ACP methyl ester carboxylesterase/acetylornithine/succinyldiaminopimelate/putrescine aminotransferase/acyl carrier protein
VTNPLQTKMEELLGDLVAEVSEMRRDAISPEADFQEFGLDSRFVIAMNSRLEQHFSGLPRTLFFEYPSIRAIAGYLVEEHADQVQALFSQAGPAAPPPPAPIPAATPRSEAPPSRAPASTAADLSDLAALAQQVPLPESIAPKAPAPSRPAARMASSDSSHDIAIVGVAGRYPKARNVEELWRNLREGRDCIEPLPKERWLPEASDPLRWGGYLDGVAEFDSLFFGISPREAETMDPQERILLEVIWETLESSGYDPFRLGRGGEPAPVGVFIGIMYAEYQVYGAELTLLGQPTLLSSSFATIPNRVSYFLNLSGPSLALDTMCSSSLTALHLACASLRAGDCKMALVGGTNLTIHPHKYRLLEAGKYLASDGRCRSYGADGDGYVPGEGVGAVLVKPLADARRDGDTIWAVVKSTSVNHGGRARGYTTPNPNAQSAGLLRALERANVEPHTLGYIEGHGTGTALGDPIEIRGLQKSLGPVAEKIPIGSIKSNIGHAEATAGVAGLTKVLLQLRAQELAPSIHSEPPNPNIDFDRAPVQVQKQVAPWKRKVITSDGVARELPRRAVVSAFGAGGSNAHVIVEEAEATALQRTVPAQPRLFVLSARSMDRLRAHAQGFLDFLSRMPPLREPEARERFYDVCATLFFGRTPFEARLAIVTDSLRALQQKLGAFVYGASKDPSILVGEGRPPPEAEGGPRSSSGLTEVALRWVTGQAVDASELFPHPWRKLPLPTYPFERRRLWAIPGETLHNLKPISPPPPPSPVHAEAARERRPEVTERPPPRNPASRPPPERSAPSAPLAAEAAPAEVVQEVLRDLVAMVLSVDRSQIRVDAKLFDYGLESVSAVELSERINAALGVDITPTTFFEFNTLAHFSQHLVDRYGLAGRLGGLQPAGGQPPAPAPAPAKAGRPTERVAIPAPAAGPVVTGLPSIEDLWASARRAEGMAEPASPEPRPAGSEITLHVIPGVDGHAVEYASVGSGPPLFVLGGLLATHEALTLNQEILSLAKRFRTIMVHPPGAGRSELPRGELTLGFVVGQIEHVRQSLGLSPIMLVGYSFGGLVAQAYATQHPARVSKLVLACTTSDPAGVVNGMHLVAAEAQRHPDALRAMQYADLSKFPLYAQLSGRLRPETFACPHVPTLIVAGAEDQYVPPLHAERLARTIPGASLHLVEGAGHFLGLSHSSTFISIVGGFLHEQGHAPVSAAAGASRRGGLRRMSQESLGALKSYLEEGEVGSGADISPVAGQVGYLINRLISGEDTPSSPYNCFFLPSGIEAVDAALRFGRRRAKLLKPGADAKTLVFDPDGALRQHFEVLPNERLFPDLVFVADPRELLGLAQGRQDVCTVYVTTACELATIEAVTAECARRGIVSVLGELSMDSGELTTSRLNAKPDVMVLDEAICGFELPFGVCAIRRFQESGVWTRQPEELAVRLPGSMMGPALIVARENILRRFRPSFTSDTTAQLRAIAVDQRRTKEAHRKYVNPVLVEALEAFGLAVRHRHADRRGYEIEREDGTSAQVINLYLITSASFRGHTGPEVAKSVLGTHDSEKDYWAELERRISRQTGFGRIFPAAGPVTAVESALKLGLLAAKRGSALLVLKGSPIFTRLGALVSQAEPGSPLAALVESCPWSKVISIDPFGEGAAAELEAKLTTGEVGFVWLESLQSDWGNLRGVPEPVLQVIDRHRERSGYLVGVDETYTSLGCGRMFHWQGRLKQPDLVSVCVGWTDSQLVAGYVLTTEEVDARARAHHEPAVSALAEQLRCQLTAHATLNLLDLLERDRVLPQIAETGKRFASALAALSAEHGLIERVWGEGLFWAVQLNLDRWPRFVRDWFSSFLWSECLRDPVAPVSLSMQPLTPACIRVEPRYDLPQAELEQAMGTLRRVLSKGVEGIVASVADDVERRGDARRAELFRRILRGFKAE